jgi:MazG family protein
MPAKKRRPAASEFSSFVKIVRRLRTDCPWDRKQTHASLRASLIEEAYETVESITRKHTDHLREELGDLLLHIVLHSVIAEQAGEFTLQDVVAGISEKMVRRHPHVFGTATARSAGQVLKNWEQIKMREGRSSVLDGVPSALPSLMRAKRLQERAANVGFDWKRVDDVWAKVREELGELEELRHERSSRRREAEFGDVLFSLVNFARFLGINPEHALHLTNAKFDKRFRHIEKTLKRRGKTPAESTLEEMDEIWNTAKKSYR